MSVPGTFKNRPGRPHRLGEMPIVSAGLRQNGALHVEFWGVGRCNCIVAREPVAADGSYRWHLSISHSSRYPTWDEIKVARYEIPTLAEVACMVQLLPLGPWTNLHENCFHFYESSPDIDLGRS